MKELFPLGSVPFGIVRYEPLHATAFVPEYVKPVALPDMVGRAAFVDLSLHAVTVFVAVRVIEYASLPSSHRRRSVFRMRSRIVVIVAEVDAAEPPEFTAVTTTVYAVAADKPVKATELEDILLSVVGVVVTPLIVYV